MASWRLIKITLQAITVTNVRPSLALCLDLEILSLVGLWVRELEGKSPRPNFRSPSRSSIPFEHQVTVTCGKSVHT